MTFTIITTGNRINKEIDNDLINEMKVVLDKYPNFKWLLVGSTVPTYLQESYSEEILKNQIKHINYEEDLIALNEICDVSINPNRIGGGYAVTSSVKGNTPVLMCNYDSDGLAFLTAENTCGDTYKELINELIRCYEDKEHREKLLEKQKIRLVIRSEDKTSELIKYFEEVQRV